MRMDWPARHPFPSACNPLQPSRLRSSPTLQRADSPQSRHFFLWRQSLSKTAKLNGAPQMALDLPYWRRAWQPMKRLARRSGATSCANRLL